MKLAYILHYDVIPNVTFHRQIIDKINTRVYLVHINLDINALYFQVL